MNIYPISDNEGALCPLCDQPIDHLGQAQIGMFEHGRWASYALVHKHCAEEAQHKESQKGDRDHG